MASTISTIFISFHRENPLPGSATTLKVFQITVCLSFPGEQTLCSNAVLAISISGSRCTGHIVCWRSSQFGLMRVRGRLQGMCTVWAWTWTYLSILSPIPFLSLLLAMNFCDSLQPIHFFFKQELVIDYLSLLTPQVLTRKFITNIILTNFIINLCKVFY